MDHGEEQQMELEFLEYMYPDELTKYTDTHYAIRIKLDTASDRSHIVSLDIRYPGEYPEVVPSFAIEYAQDGDGDDESAEEYGDDESDDDEETRAAKRALNLPEYIEFDNAAFAHLHSKLAEEAETQLGLPMVDALINRLKEEAEAYFEATLATQQKHHDRRQRELEREEQKKFNGTPVTKESFAEWRVRFRAELDLEGQQKRRFDNMHQGKMSGRETFERGLAGNEDDDELAADVADVKLD